MDKLKFFLFSIVILSLLGIIGYWSITTIQSGTEFEISQRIDELEKENEDLKKEIIDLKDEIDTLSLLKVTDEIDTEVITEDEKIETPTTTTPTTYKNQTLINKLQELINSKVSMKLKSYGTRVGTVQTFLNIYNKTSNKIDNDYGATTKKLVESFQKSQGLTADGEAGPSTFSKMIDWLKKQG